MVERQAHCLWQRYGGMHSKLYQLLQCILHNSRNSYHCCPLLRVRLHLQTAALSQKSLSVDNAVLLQNLL